MTPPVIFAALLGAIGWNLFTWLMGLPTSSSHALIGGYAGAAIVKAGPGVIIAHGWFKTVLFIFVAPVLGMVLGVLFITVTTWIVRKGNPTRINKAARRLQLLSAALYSLGHGGNDAQKTMGIIASLIFAAGWIKTFHIPLWVVLSRPRRDRPGHALRRLAHRQDHGPEDHQAPPDRRLLRRDGQRHQHLLRDPRRRPGQHDPRHHRGHLRRRRGQAPVGRPLGRDPEDRLGLDLHHPRRRPDRRDSPMSSSGSSTGSWPRS